MRHAYEVIAQYSNRDAGYVGSATTREGAQRLQRTTQMTTVVRRMRVTDEHFAAIAAREEAE